MLTRTEELQATEENVSKGPRPPDTDNAPERAPMRPPAWVGAACGHRLPESPGTGPSPTTAVPGGSSRDRTRPDPRRAGRLPASRGRGQRLRPPAAGHPRHRVPGLRPALCPVWVKTCCFSAGCALPNHPLNRDNSGGAAGCLQTPGASAMPRGPQPGTPTPGTEHTDARVPVQQGGGCRPVLAGNWQGPRNLLSCRTGSNPGSPEDTLAWWSLHPGRLGSPELPVGVSFSLGCSGAAGLWFRWWERA